MYLKSPYGRTGTDYGVSKRYVLQFFLIGSVVRYLFEALGHL